ncbi:hypothetical protein TZ03_06355 [Pseudomonas sp. 10-1B]|nr:hypothetical protein TZ03_06355 [Pseudomonas sp. 10-1B]
MNDATATSAVEGFSTALNRVPLAARKTMTYDQGREMVRHAEITQNWQVSQTVVSMPFSTGVCK